MLDSITTIRSRLPGTMKTTLEMVSLFTDHNCEEMHLGNESITFDFVSTSGGIIERGGSSIWVIINDIFGQDLFRTLTTLIVVLIAGISTVPQFWWVFVIPIPIHLYFTSYMR
jgi:hypothetical protein